MERDRLKPEVGSSASQLGPLEALISRRELVVKAGIGGSALFLATLPAPMRALIQDALGDPRSGLSEDQRHTLRGLWDAVIPGTWEGTVEDWLEPGVPAPGADDARVQDWLEQVSASMPWPLDWLTEAFMGLWADDVNLWADVVHWPPFDGSPKFWELPLGPSIFERGRQRKIILMQQLFHTLIDLKYQSGIMISKIAFFCDFYFEANEPETLVGREYIGWPLPPGTTPYEDFTYNQVLGDHDDRLVEVNPPRNLVALP